MVMAEAVAMDMSHTYEEADVPAGYRRTQIGIIPEGWELKPIGELLEFKNGLNKAKQYFGYGTPIINYMDVFDHTGIREEHVEGLVDVTKNEIEAYSARKGDVLFTRTSETLEEIGYASVVLEDIEAAVFSGFVLRGRPKSDELTYDFKRYCFRSEAVRKQIISKGTYTTRALTNGRALSSVLLPFPKRECEQRAIAAALQDQDELISSLELLIEKKRAIKQGVMRELLTGTRRLPGFAEDWCQKPLSSVAEIRSGGTPSTSNPDYWNGEVLWCTPTDITALKGFKYLETTERKITAAGLAVSSAEVIPPNSIIMTSRATIGECAINTTPLTTNQGFKNLVPLKGTDAEFLYYLMLTQKENLISLCGGSTFLEIGKSQLVQFGVLVPSSEDEQTAIANVISDMDQDIFDSLKQLEKAKSIKEGMMHSLLAGKVRFV